MRLGRRVFLVIGRLAVVCVLGALALLFELSYRPTYDQSDPNYRRYLEVFDRLRQDLDYRGATRDDYVDLTQLDVDWDGRAPCVSRFRRPWPAYAPPAVATPDRAR